MGKHLSLRAGIVGSNPTLHYFFFRKFRIGYNEGKWNSLGYARRWLRRHNHANSSMVEHSK